MADEVPSEQGKRHILVDLAELGRRPDRRDTGAAPSEEGAGASREDIGRQAPHRGSEERSR